MKPWMILAPLAFAASAHATELNLGAHLEGSPLVLSKLSPDGGWLAGAAVHATCGHRAGLVGQCRLASGCVARRAKQSEQETTKRAVA
jgi:hypothetical protein